MGPASLTVFCSQFKLHFAVFQSLVIRLQTQFCTCHSSTTVAWFTKCRSNHFVRIEYRAKWSFYRIWFAIEKPLVNGFQDHRTTRWAICNCINISELYQHCPIQWPVAFAVPIHDLYRILSFFNEEDAYEKVSQPLVMLSRIQYDKSEYIWIHLWRLVVSISYSVQICLHTGVKRL